MPCKPPLRLILAPGLGLLSACHVRVWDVCELHPTPIEEDDDRIGISPAAALLAVAGPYTVPGQLESGETVEVTISVERAGGGARYIRSEQVERRERRPSLNVGWSRTDELVICEDSIDVPVRIGLRTGDGEIDIEARTPLVVTDPEKADFYFWPASFDRRWPADEVEDIPPHSEGRRQDEAYVSAAFDLEGQVRGVVGWLGHEGGHYWSDRVLEWGMEEDTGAP